MADRPGSEDLTGRYQLSAAAAADLLDLAHDAVIVREPADSRVVYWNREAAEIYGYSAPEAHGRITHDLLHTEFPGSREVVDAALLQHGRWDGELGHTCKDGERIVVASRQALQRDAGGEPIAVIELNSDITERKRVELALERSNTELEQFASVASHDLQEPLRTVAGFAQLLERRYGDELDDAGQRFIGFLVKGVERMQTMIDDLLSYSRAGQAGHRCQRVDSRELVEGALTALDAAVQDADAEVSVGELPVVVADPGALAQVFQNLLSNALKFTDGPPRIDVSASRRDAGWTFAVADEGLGIDPAHAERVFRMFERLHGLDDYAGTGIGLPLCRRIVERHGGRIWCEPRAGGGSVFRFTLPDQGPVAGTPVEG